MVERFRLFGHKPAHSWPSAIVWSNSGNTRLCLRIEFQGNSYSQVARTRGGDVAAYRCLEMKRSQMAVSRPVPGWRDKP